MIKQLRVVNTTRRVVLATDARAAVDPWTRMVGLLGRANFAPGEGLQITPCQAVHTFFMRFPIDVLFLDRDGRVARAAPVVRPFRCLWGGRRAHSVLELPSGTITATGTTAGDQVAVH